MKYCAKERARCSSRPWKPQWLPYIETHQHEVDENGRRLVVRNGHARERTIVSGVGQLKIQAPRVDDRRVDEQGRRFRFTSEILPPYLRRTKSVEELIPWLYLKGISTGDFSEALEALLGPDAAGLSATTVVRLKDVWRREYEAWSKRDLSVRAGRRYFVIHTKCRWISNTVCAPRRYSAIPQAYRAARSLKPSPERRGL